MPKFMAGDPLNISINLRSGERLLVPGIAIADSYIGTRTNLAGAHVPSEFVDAITYHDVPADQSSTGEARRWYQQQPQAAFFASLRSEPCEAIDSLSAEELFEAVAESVAAVQKVGQRAVASAKPARVKAVFGARQPAATAK